MNAWKVILATLVIFVAGVVTGALVVWHSQRIYPPTRQHPANAQRPAAPASPGGMRLEFLRRAQRDLNLTPQQNEQVDKILKESQERSKKVMEPVMPELREQLQRTHEAFRQVLTPEQRGRFDDLVKHSGHGHEQRRPTGAPERTGTVAVTNAP